MTSEFTDLGPPGTATMLSVLVGASDYPRKPDWSNPVLGASAQALRDYVLSPAGLALAPMQLLDLFDDDASPDGQLHRIADFLAAARGARDLLVYYIGHGGFHGDEYYLGIRNTKRDREFFTTIESKKLAKLIRDEFRRKRVYVILDSCFSAAAASDWQGNEIAVAVRRMSQRLPAYGTVLLAAASKYDVARAPRTERCTVFTGAVLSALTRGVDRAQPKLSIYDLYEEVRDVMRHRENDYDGMPEIYVPNQRDGDVSRLPLFPNAAYAYTEAYHAAIIDVEAAEAAAARARGEATARSHVADTARMQLRTAEFEAAKALDEAEQAKNEVAERERDVEQARDRLKAAQIRLAARTHLAAVGSGVSSVSDSSILHDHASNGGRTSVVLASAGVVEHEHGAESLTVPRTPALACTDSPSAAPGIGTKEGFAQTMGSGNHGKPANRPRAPASLASAKTSVDLRVRARVASPPHPAGVEPRVDTADTTVRDHSVPDPPPRRSARVIAAITLAGAAFIACTMYVTTTNRAPTHEEPPLNHGPAGPDGDAVMRPNPDRNPVVTNQPTTPPKPQAPVAPDPKPVDLRAQEPQSTDQKGPDSTPEHTEGEGPTAHPTIRAASSAPKNEGGKITDTVNAGKDDDNEISEISEIKQSKGVDCRDGDTWCRAHALESDGKERCRTKDKTTAQTDLCNINKLGFPGIGNNLLQQCHNDGIQLADCADGRQNP